MKKIWMMTLLCAAVTPACGELLSEVTYNPSRMGTYDYLKVTDRAGLEGGLQVNQLNLRSGGEIGLNKGSNISYYTVTEVKGASGSSVDMPDTSFHGNGALTPSNYAASSSAVLPYNRLSQINIKGGEMSFGDDSYLGTVNAVNRLKQYAGSVSGGTLTVNGDNGAGIGLYNGGSTAGFYLSGNDIPVPVGKYVNGNKTLKSCKLAWEERTLSAGGKAKVLALKGCTAAGDNPSSGYKWTYDKWITLATYECDAAWGGGEENALARCSGIPKEGPSGICSKKGETRYANCGINNGCPGSLGIEVEVDVYICE